MRITSIPASRFPSTVIAAVVVACLLGACAGAASSRPPTPSVAEAFVAEQTEDRPTRTITTMGPPAAGLELETVSSGSRRHTTLRTVAGTLIEYRIDGADWFVRSGVDGAGLPTDRWVHIDLDEIRAAGVEVPEWMTDRVDDAGFVFDLAVGDVHAGETVIDVERSDDGARVVVTFDSGLRARGERTVAPAGTAVTLPDPADVVSLAELRNTQP